MADTFDHMAVILGHKISPSTLACYDVGASLRRVLDDAMKAPATTAARASFRECTTGASSDAPTCHEAQSLTPSNCRWEPSDRDIAEYIEAECRERSATNDPVRSWIDLGHTGTILLLTLLRRT